MIEKIASPYPVVIGDSALSELNDFVKKQKASSVFILTDENVNAHCLPLIIDCCRELKSATVIEIPAGEEEKNLTTTAKVLSLLYENNADRKSILVNLGGGVISDIGGFVASIYKRGLRFINVPTSLLGMVDASIGGKNGVNFHGGKNIIGSFTQPAGVFIYPKFIDTLQAEEKKSAYAEIIKHILLSDADRWSRVIAAPDSLGSEGNLDSLIEHSVKFKTAIITEDFTETGKRAILNFGHTAGHAIEAHSLSTGNTLRHGEAIAAGMIAELFLSQRHAGFPEKDIEAAVQFIRNFFSDINLSCSPEDLIQFLYADKKNSRDRIAFSLLKSPGVPAGNYFPEIDSIVESLIFMNEIFSKADAQ